ncbi:MAG: HAMP domain-containing protein [Leptospiraceae bacterium]|nr:HAMP domain-containing protein [Leptospiraceae bacterium]
MQDAPEISKYQILKIFILVTVLNLGANLLVVIPLNVFYVPLLKDPLMQAIAEHLTRDSQASLVYNLTGFLSFAVPSLISTIYTWPLIQMLYARSDVVLQRVRRRVLNMPLMMGAITLLGWLIGFIQNYISLYYFISDSSTWSFTLLRSVLIVLVLASLCFALVYYSVDILLRHRAIPLLFPENKLSQTKGVIYLSIGKRFMILVTSVTLPVVILLFNLLLNRLESSALDEVIRPTVFIILALLVANYGIGYLVAASLSKPIDQMKAVTADIMRGEYSQQAAVRSVDETGVLAETINQMSRGLQEKELIKDTFGKAVDPRVRDYLLQGDLQLGGQLKQAAILFCDIRSFTAFCENRSPESIVEILNYYFTEMSRCIQSHQGMINKYIGDAIMAIFNLPLPLENFSQRAVEAALDMLQALDQVNEQLGLTGPEAIRIGIGLHAGAVLAGNIGSRDRLEYTVIGDAVNIASRLEGLTKELQSPLVISEDIYTAINTQNLFTGLGSSPIRGRQESLQIYGLQGTPE